MGKLTRSSVDSLIDQAFKVLKPVTGEDRAAIAAQLLPESPQWFSITKPFLTIPPDPSLAITNPLGGAVYMVDRSDEKLELKATGDVPRDSNGYSPALRMAIYVSSLIANSDIFELISTEQRTDIAFYLSLLLSLASDNLGLEGANDLWIQYNSEVDDEMTQFVSRTQTLVARWLETTDSPDLRSTTEAGFLGVAGRRLLDRSLGLSATAYNSARAFSAIQSELIELHGMDPKVTMEESVLKTIRKGSDVFHSIALLTGLRPRKDSIKLCNEIIADLTGLRLERNQTESEGPAVFINVDLALTGSGLRQLIILNSILQNQDGIADGIPQQRLVFLTKHFISSLKQETMSPPVIAEILRVFEVVLPIIKGIYGSHWAEILQLLSGLWSPRLSGDGQELPVIHASLRLYMAIKTIIGDDDGNDDLEDAWKECLGALSKGLINLLKQSRGWFPYDTSELS